MAAKKTAQSILEETGNAVLLATDEALRRAMEFVEAAKGGRVRVFSLRDQIRGRVQSATSQHKELAAMWARDLKSAKHDEKLGQLAAKRRADRLRVAIIYYRYRWLILKYTLIFLIMVIIYIFSQDILDAVGRFYYLLEQTVETWFLRLSEAEGAASSGDSGSSGAPPKESEPNP